MKPSAVPIAISARHAHLRQITIEQLFGEGHRLHPCAWLSQPGEFAAEETVSVLGPRGKLERVRLLGPPRHEDQIEISRSDGFTLGVHPPIRLSGDTVASPGIMVVGPVAWLKLGQGLICAARHLHVSPAEAAELGLRNHQIVRARTPENGRALEFADIHVRISPDYRFELHLDTDEANAANVRQGDEALLLLGAD